MEVTIFTNFKVSDTHWYNIIDESYEINTIQSSEPKWTIELPRNELTKLSQFIDESKLTPKFVRDDSITIYAVLDKIPELSIHSVNRLFSKRMADEMEDFANIIETETCDEDDVGKGIWYGGGVDVNLVNSITSMLKTKIGFEIDSELRWEDSSDQDCYVRIPLPDNFDPFAELGYEFDVYTDSEDLLQEISDHGIEGLEVGKLQVVQTRIWEELQPFEIRGPVGTKKDKTMKSLIDITNNFLHEHLNVDRRHQILRITESSRQDNIELYLPIQQYRDQLLPSNVAVDNSRYMIHIQSDSEDELERFGSRFRGLGYLVMTDVIDGESVIQYHSNRKSVKDAREQFEDCLAESETLHDGFVTINNSKLHSHAVKLVLPTETSSVQKRVSGVDTLSIRYQDKDTKDKLKQKLRTIGCDSLYIRDNINRSELKINFGGVKIEQIILLDSTIRRIFNIPEDENTTFNNGWSDDDLDVSISIPKAYKISTSSIEEDSISQWLDLGEAGSSGPFIHVESGESVRIGATVLNIYDNDLNLRSPPNADQFGLYCIDQATANTLNIVASNVASGEPCLLEGETATSKTSIIRFLAHLMRQPVTRINLNGQTDTGELIGRYVPNDSEDSSVQWVWENGEIIKAMKYGWWVILDEVNLAEPQILERLNSLLENPPELTATEKSPPIELGGPTGELVHPSFRIFATMNPAEYSGRIALSPAYKDRWTGYSYVPLASEMEILHMLNMWVFGETPPVTVDGVQYDGKAVNVPMSNLHELSKSLDVKDLIARIARSHYTLSKLASTDNSKGISMSRKERPVFSRRLLTRFMTYLDENIRPESDVGELSRVVRLGLVRYYIRRVHSEEDLAIISETLDGQGIGPNIWNLWTE